MNRKQKAEADIQRIKKEEADKMKAICQHFVGKYIHIAPSSYEKIIGIDWTDKDEVGYELELFCIQVYYDNRGDEYNNYVSINTQVWRQADVEDIEKHLISPETFNKALNDCIDFIKRRLA